MKPTIRTMKAASKIDHSWLISGNFRLMNRVEPERWGKTMPAAIPSASPRPPSRGIAPWWIRRNWSGRSMAPTQLAIWVTSGVASTQPIIASAKIIR